MEARILVYFGFDVNFPGPVDCMDRYLRLLGHNKTDIVQRMCFTITKYALNESCFLDYRPSQIVASAAILSVNIYKRDLERF